MRRRFNGLAQHLVCCEVFMMRRPALPRLNAMASPAAQLPGPLGTFVCRLTVAAKVDSIGFAVLKWIHCSAGKL